MPSDPKATIRYAVDLLRAHQIRRENLFLHGELQSCREEVAALRDEIRDVKVNAQNYRPQLEEQRQELGSLQQICNTVQTEVAILKGACDKSREHAVARWILLERQIDVASLECRNGACIRQQQEQSITAALESMRQTIEEKADAKCVDNLNARVDALCTGPPSGSILESVSRVQDSVGQRGSCQQPDATVQVHDSQAGHRSDPQTGPHPPKAQQLREHMTMADDLDLDANANTISYTGHLVHLPEEDDTMKELPRPQIQASQLALIKTLRQRRFDDWDRYYSQGRSLVETMPQEFEETIVRDFVEGIFKGSQREQCRQWLDSNGWSWESITSFRHLCSQLLADPTQDPVDDITGVSTLSREMGKMGAGEETSRQAGQWMNPGKTQELRPRVRRVSKPTRRGQGSGGKERHGTGELTQDLFKIQQGRHPEECVRGKHLTRGPDINGVNPKMPRQSVPSKSRLSPEDVDEVFVDVDRSVPTSGTIDRAESQVLGHGEDGSKAVSGGMTGSKRRADSLETDPQPTVEEIAERASKRPKAALEGSVDGGIPVLRPQLVSGNRKVAKQTDDSSDDGGYLFERKPAKQHPQKAALRRKGHTRRRLPLPPPPEIPILPTSNED